MVEKAVSFATKCHEGTYRKGSQIPYIVHPLETAVIVSLMTDDEELICAALLHDVIEDAGVTENQLEEEFGYRVAHLVMEETEDKTKSWKERKRATLKHLEHASKEVKILVLADKLSNLRTTARDYLLMGDEIWQRFNEKDKLQHAWYYTTIAARLSELDSFTAYKEYKALCDQVFGAGE
ncbi:HD domain-containing protein [Clostridium boliviensis]|uniref:HD domain-containing protein n=1 Tax=Clostridium boliviensis TaxID=318465 RepID=A0ABU4GQA1_9CLOT|nr:HD domain-containing protein [Clostridium boliviensis]MDW2799774.1 HD domain-containing protein [Clostridium boliviensis]